MVARRTPQPPAPAAIVAPAFPVTQDDMEHRVNLAITNSKKDIILTPLSGRAYNDARAEVAQGMRFAENAIMREIDHGSTPGYTSIFDYLLTTSRTRDFETLKTLVTTAANRRRR